MEQVEPWLFSTCIRNYINPKTPISDQDRISPYNIKQAGDENREEYQSWDY